MPQRHSVRFAFFLIVAQATLAAQVRQWSGMGYTDLETKSVRQDSNSNQLVWALVGFGAEEGVITMPYDMASGVHDYGPGILVGGLDSASDTGYVCRLAFPAGASVPTLTLSSLGVGVDASAVFLDAMHDRVYAIDQRAGRVMTTSWSVFGAGTWTEIASHATIPFLSPSRIPEFAEFLPVPNGGDGVSLMAKEPFTDLRYDITWSGTAWIVAPYIPPLPPPCDCWVVEDATYVSAGETHYTLRIAGGQGLFAVTDSDTQAIVFVGDHDQPADILQEIQVPVASMLYGHRYAIHSIGQSLVPSIDIRVVPEWHRNVFPLAMESGQLQMRWDFPTVGTDTLAYNLRWSAGGAPPSTPFLVTMVMGDWQLGTDPTVAALGLNLLAQQYGVLGSVTADFDVFGHASVAYAFSVNNPALAGLHVALQAVGISPSSELFCSDVLGVKLAQ